MLLEEGWAELSKPISLPLPLCALKRGPALPCANSFGSLSSCSLNYYNTWKYV